MSPKDKEYNKFKQVCVIKNNAKEKAEELIWKFGKSINNLDMSYQQAKECALIAVEEMTKQCWDYRDIDLEASYDYWNKVKKEIELL